MGVEVLLKNFQQENVKISKFPNSKMPKNSGRKWQILWMSKLRNPNRGHARYREVRGLLREARAEHRQSSLQRQENLHRQSWSDFKHIDCKVYQNAVQK